MQSPKDQPNSLSHCNICNSPCSFFGKAEVLQKYNVQYFRCNNCGFIQTEPPYWLEEAYSAAIAPLDVGIMRRNLLNAELTTAVLQTLFNNAGRCVDFGAGHGVLVRMMRDRGFDFHWYDLHATNDYARGFEYKEGDTYDLLTAFEVLEHFTDPVADLARLMTISDNVFVSTDLVPEPVPGVNDWWYFAPRTGQHLAFYTPKALQILAERFGRHLLSVGGYHLFSKEPKSKLAYKLATNRRSAWLINHVSRRPTLIDSDCDFLTRTIGAGPTDLPTEPR